MNPKLKKLLSFPEKFKKLPKNLKSLQFSKSDFLIDKKGIKFKHVFWGFLVLVILGETAYFSFLRPATRLPASLVTKSANLISEQLPVQSNDETKTLHEQALKYFNQGKYPEAVKNWETVLDNGLVQSSIVSNLAVSYFKLGKIEEAEKYAEKSLKEPGVGAIEVNNYGTIQLEVGEWQKAQESFQRALKMDPSYVDPYLNLGRLYENQKHWKKAINSYEKYVKHPGSDRLMKKILKSRIRKIYAISMHGKKGERK